MPIVAIVIVAASVVFDAFYHHLRPYKIVWIVVAALTCETKLWGLTIDVFRVPHWLWQMILVPIALLLAVTPLIRETKLRGLSVGETLDPAIS